MAGSPWTRGPWRTNATSTRLASPPTPASISCWRWKTPSGSSFRSGCCAGGRLNRSRRSATRWNPLRPLPPPRPEAPVTGIACSAPRACRGAPAEVAARIGREVAGPAAAAVDRDASFPHEAMAALRAERMLGAMVPADLGGGGASLREVALAVQALGEHCASTAMVYAMHQIEVACLARHGHTPFLREALARVAGEQLLLASATTEAGIGGDIRSSSCAVHAAGGRFRLEKHAPVISYGAQADGILVTARRAPDAAPSDQVLIYVLRDTCRLTPAGTWNTLGFRGTCSLGFRLAAEGDVRQ